MAHQALSETPMVGVRLGALRSRVEAACERQGVDMSEFIRRAVERELLRSDSFEGFAVCLQAVRSFKRLLDAARAAGLVESEPYQQVKDPLWRLQFGPKGLQEKLETFFANAHPEAVEAEERFDREFKKWKRDGRKGPEPVLEDSTRENWWDGIRARYSFLDLNRAADLLFEMKSVLPEENLQGESGKLKK